MLVLSVVLNLITLVAVSIVLMILYIGFRQNSSVQNLSQLVSALQEKGIRFPIKANVTGEIGNFYPSQFFDGSINTANLKELETAQVPYYADFELT